MSRSALEVSILKVSSGDFEKKSATYRWKGFTRKGVGIDWVQKFVKKRENVKSAKNQGFKLFGVCMSKRILTPLKGIHQVRI